VGESKRISNDRLERLFRQAVLAYWGCDPFDGTSDPEQLQAHHVVPRRHWRLRWDYRNGIALSIASHNRAHSDIAFRRQIEELVDFDYLADMQRWTRKDWLFTHGISDDDFRAIMADELRMVIEQAPRVALKRPGQ
jgi:Formylmethanofuran dehydrogenase subunit B